MTVIDPTISLAGLVTVHPELGRVLERLGLDYCCHGDRRLQDACAAAGLDQRDVIAQLEREAGEPSAVEWALLDAVDLVVHIDTVHHRYLWDEMPRLSELAAKVASVHGGRHPELADVTRVYEALRAELEPHLVKEERVLFPMIAALAGGGSVAAHCGTIQAPISVMWREHDAAGELLAELRLLTHGYEVPDDGCASYHLLYKGLEEMEHDVHLHIMKENTRLFPLAVELETAGRLRA